MHADLSRFIQQHDKELGNYLRMFRKMECCWVFWGFFFALGFYQNAWQIIFFKKS